MLTIVGKRFTGTVEEEGETALQASGDLRPCPLPGSPFRERTNPRQFISIGQLFEQQVGQRSGRLADGESRMAAAFDHRHAPAATRQREGDERAGEPGTDHCHVSVDVFDRCDGHEVTPKPHTAHEGREKTPLFEIDRVKARAPRLETVRAGRKAPKVPEIDEDPAAIRTHGKRRLDAALDVLEPWRPKVPSAAKASSAPLPDRVGIERHHRGAAGECDIDRSLQPVVLLRRPGQTAAR